MLETYAGFRIEAPAADVWSMINWSGIERLQGKGTFYKRVEFSTREPIVGATRRLTPANDGAGITEVLLSYEEGRRRYTYGVLDGGDLPLGNYTGQVCVTPAGPNACTLCFSSRGVPVGISAEDFQTFYTQAETGIANAIRTALGCK